MPKRRVPPPDEPSDPAIRAFTEKVLSLFAARCAVFKIDPGSKDFWRLMSCAFAFEHLLAECRPPAKAKQTKPQRWTASEKKRLLESVRKKVAGGGTVENAIKRASSHQTLFRQSKKPRNEVLRSARVGTRGQTGRDRKNHTCQIAGGSTRTNTAEANKKSAAGSTNS